MTAPDRKTDKTSGEASDPTVEEELVQDGGPGVESRRDIRSMTMLRELVEEVGIRKAADQLGLSERSVYRAFEAGRPSRRLRIALEMHLLMGGGTAAAKQRELLQTLQQRMDALASKVATVDDRVEALVKDLQDELRQLREVLEGQSEAINLLERRTNWRDTRRGAGIPTSPDLAGLPTGPGPRVYRELVTLEPEDGEEEVYGEAAPLVVEWRNVRKKVLSGADARSARQAVDRLRELEIALIGQYGLTLPPALYPWDRFQRRDELERRTRAMEESRRKGIRAPLVRWLRRVVAGR